LILTNFKSLIANIKNIMNIFAQITLIKSLW